MVTNKNLSFLVKLARSFGLKRTIAGYLATLIEAVKQVPALAHIIPELQIVGAAFGVTGLAHAVGKKTINKYKLASLSALLVMLVGAAQYIPALMPYAEALQTAAAILGAITLGSNLKS